MLPANVIEKEMEEDIVLQLSWETLLSLLTLRTKLIWHISDNFCREHIINRNAILLSM